MRILLAVEALKSLHTQDKSERLTAAEGHLSSTWYAGEVAGKSFNTSGPPDSSGRNTVWNFTSSVFMTVGDADTHPGRSSHFESHVVRQRIHVHASVLEVSDNFHIFLRARIWDTTSREDRPRILKSMCCLPCLAVSLSLSASGHKTGIVNYRVTSLLRAPCLADLVLDLRVA